GLAGRPVGLLRRPLSGAVPDPRARRRGARHRPRALHDTDGARPLARAAARAGDREPALRRRRRAGRRDNRGEAGVRALADRRPVGDRARAGARRGDGDRRGARPAAVARDPYEAALAREPPARRVSMEELVERWQLTVGDEYPPGAAGRVFRVERADGTPAVLKISVPHREAEQEADALERWNGEGAVRLLERDDACHALLLERCEPGAFLSESPDALDVLIGLLPRLWTKADGFHTLADEAEWWIEEDLRSARLGDLAAGLLRELVPSQGEQVLVHQDL